MDWGKFRDSLDYGHHQLGISEELDNPQMRAEAYLNLSRAHERLGCLERALMYARHSLYNECDSQSRNGGLVHVKYEFLNFYFFLILRSSTAHCGFCLFGIWRIS